MIWWENPLFSETSTSFTTSWGKKTSDRNSCNSLVSWMISPFFGEDFQATYMNALYYNPAYPLTMSRCWISLSCQPFHLCFPFIHSYIAAWKAVKNICMPSCWKIVGDPFLCHLSNKKTYQNHRKNGIEIWTPIRNIELGGGFKDVLFSPLAGEMIQVD